MSDTADRIARVTRAADETFGNPEKARAWLQRANRALGGSSPLDMLDSDDGADHVEQVLGRLAHGLFS